MESFLYECIVPPCFLKEEEMKRIISCILMLVLTVTVFGACSAKSEDAKTKETVDTAIEKTSKLDDISYEHTTNINYGVSGGSYYIKTVNNYMAHSMNNIEKFEMSEDSTVTYSASGSQKTNETYYKDGCYYTDRYTGLFKAKTQPDNVGAIKRGAISGIKFDDMRSFSLDETSDGGYKVSFTCKNSKLREYIDSAFSVSDEEFGEYSIKTASGEYTVDKNGYLLKEEMRISIAYTQDGEDVTTTLVSSVSYKDTAKEINPYDPEDGDYVAVDSIEDIANLNSAMSTTLTANSYNMTAKISADNEWDGKKPQYKRDYVRCIDTKNEVLKQEAKTAYYSDGKIGDTVLSAQYYTDGKYYNYSDLYSSKVYCPMDFSTYYQNIYIQNSVTPADVVSLGTMKDIKVKKEKEDTVYTFGLNSKTDSGINFIASLVGPYTDFDGDFAKAEIKVNDFDGKIYVNSKGEYYRTTVKGNIVCTFKDSETNKEYAATIDFSQDIKVSDINGSPKVKFPSLDGYERTQLSELLGAYQDDEK